MRSPKLRRFLILCAISAVAAIACSALIHNLALHLGWDALPLLYQIPMGLLLATLFTVLPVVAVALIILGVTAVIPRWRKRSLQQSMGIIIGFYGVFLSHMVASATTSLVITGREMDRAQAFGNRLIPQIEAYKAQHGHYPENLDEFEQPGKRPHFCAIRSVETDSDIWG